MPTASSTPSTPCSASPGSRPASTAWSWSEAPIGELVAELAELYEAVAEEEQDGLDFRVSIEANPTYRCNPHLVAQAVTNLLDNAMKYTPHPGTVTLAVRGDEERFAIVVTDTGPGIPAHERGRVFERFVRLENERNSPGQRGSDSASSRRSRGCSTRPRSSSTRRSPTLLRAPIRACASR